MLDQTAGRMIPTANNDVIADFYLSAAAAGHGGGDENRGNVGGQQRQHGDS